MGKRIIQQARGRGGPVYRVRKRAFRYTVGYPTNLSGEGIITEILNSPAHSAPLAKVKYSEGFFYIPAFRGMAVDLKVNFGVKEIKEGNILELSNIPIKTQVYNIESKPKDGGVFIRTAGTCGIITKVIGDKVYVLMPSKKEKEFNGRCRATIGVVAGSGRLEKPIVKAGKRYYIMKSKGKLWPRTSAVKMNIVDHPFGSGRGKNPKSKIAKRNASPGKKVGHIRPRRTGKRK